MMWLQLDVTDIVWMGAAVLFVWPFCEYVGKIAWYWFRRVILRKKSPPSSAAVVFYLDDDECPSMVTLNLTKDEFRGIMLPQIKELVEEELREDTWKQKTSSHYLGKGSS